MQSFARASCSSTCVHSGALTAHIETGDGRRLSLPLDAAPPHFPLRREIKFDQIAGVGAHIYVSVGGVASHARDDLLGARDRLSDFEDGEVLRAALAAHAARQHGQRRVLAVVERVGRQRSVVERRLAVHAHLLSVEVEAHERRVDVVVRLRELVAALPLAVQPTRLVHLTAVVVVVPMLLVAHVSVIVAICVLVVAMIRVGIIIVVIG